jgi:hypothetical protein
VGAKKSIHQLSHAGRPGSVQPITEFVIEGGDVPQASCKQILFKGRTPTTDRALDSDNRDVVVNHLYLALETAVTDDDLLGLFVKSDSAHNVAHRDVVRLATGRTLDVKTLVMFTKISEL